VNNVTDGAFQHASYRAHERLYENRGTVVDTWKQTDTVDAWRHGRMYRTIDPILKHFPGQHWVTVGDGRYGTDAHYLETKGAKATATDIADTMLQRAKAEGYIHEFSRENAERLSFQDNSFDFALCKESYHHFPRPMLALYELLRVARKGVVLIEPNETPILMGKKHILKMAAKECLRTVGLGKLFAERNTSIVDHGSNWYEPIGNFGYAISTREIERVALGLNLPTVAFAGLNDHYIEGVQNQLANDSSPVFREIKAEIARLDRECKRGFSRSRPKLLVALILKETPTAEFRAALLAAGYDVRTLPRNPYLKSADHSKET
jgi:ubiquinone/menaquinone biosynthesis C-methylase UbiE